MDLGWLKAMGAIRRRVVGVRVAQRHHRELVRVGGANVVPACRAQWVGFRVVWIQYRQTDDTGR